MGAVPGSAEEVVRLGGSVVWAFWCCMRGRGWMEWEGNDQYCKFGE